MCVCVFELHRDNLGMPYILLKIHIIFIYYFLLCASCVCVCVFVGKSWPKESPDGENMT